MSDLRITEAFLYMDYLCFRALCCKGPPPARPEYDLVCIGLTGSGKTSLLSKLCSESPDNIVSTTGADNIRKYWSRYYQGSQGVIFVLDSASSEDDLETSRNELHSALQHPQLCTLPFLILANHQDKPAARSVQEIKHQSFLPVQWGPGLSLVSMQNKAATFSSYFAIFPSPYPLPIPPYITWLGSNRKPWT
ncbi:ADP-ribosylation factor-like protein 15 isoform X4 [Erinaceus europaeus]|uniref:ADP-ribosylation factor-like protein 15 isoform X4 n=1 Tax=Erinaceus europaeus TaxID=9365 RepID=A0ABM3XDV6_ERIEU|nr:ADP-ribosylation factor-like protein 15 isoform X4 [Erinaceus europaeus]